MTGQSPASMGSVTERDGSRCCRPDSAGDERLSSDGAAGAEHELMDLWVRCCGARGPPICRELRAIR
jgi:hypothetical protein